MMYDELLDDRRRINDIQATMQKSLDSRLDGLRFAVATGDEFDAEIGNHSIHQITFVVRATDNIELYKGDNKIGSMGGVAGTRGPMRGGETIAIDHCIVYGNYGL